MAALKIKLLKYCYLLQYGILLSSISNSIGSYLSISESYGISSDFHANTGYFKRVHRRYFYIEDNYQVSWFAALHKCRELGADLGSFQFKDEYDEVIELLKKSTRKTYRNTKECYWLDPTNYANESIYTSMTTGLPPVILKWGNVEPNNINGNEHCVQLVAYNRKRFVMNDNQCTHNCYFICNYKMPTQTNIVAW